MDTKFKLEGHITFPEGSKFSDKQRNMVILPDGRTINVHPVLVLSKGEDEDDHRNISENEVHEAGPLLATLKLMFIEGDHGTVFHKGPDLAGIRRAGDILEDLVDSNSRQEFVDQSDPTNKFFQLSNTAAVQKGIAADLGFIPVQSASPRYPGAPVPQAILNTKYFVKTVRTKLSDLAIGDEFVYDGRDTRYRITDIGSRTATYIALDQEDPRNYNGPPYSVCESVMDEDDILSIRLVKKGGKEIDPNI